MSNTENYYYFFVMLSHGEASRSLCGRSMFVLAERFFTTFRMTLSMSNK